MSKFVLERVTQPDIEPVTLAEMIQQVHEFSSIAQAAQDELTGLIKAAREWVEDYTGRALIEQRWRLTLLSDSATLGYTDTNTVTGIYVGEWSPSVAGVLLRKSPVLGLVSVSTITSSGVETAQSVAGYEVREANSKWPRFAALSGTWGGDSMRIVFRAGFADRLGSPTQDATVVPVRFKQAIKLWAEAMYDRDEKTMGTLLEAAKTLIKPERSELQIA